MNVKKNNSIEFQCNFKRRKTDFETNFCLKKNNHPKLSLEIVEITTSNPYSH